MGQYFWAVLYELSEHQLRALINSLVSPLHSGGTASLAMSASGGLPSSLKGSSSASSTSSTSSSAEHSNAGKASIGALDFLSFASFSTFQKYLKSPGGMNHPSAATKQPSASSGSSPSRPVNTFIYFQIIAPTALALLSPDSADITVFEFTNKKSVSESPFLSLKISIPRYSSLQIMSEKVLQLVKLTLNANNIH
jgi:hypothetical protein